MRRWWACSLALVHSDFLAPFPKIFSHRRGSPASRPHTRTTPGKRRGAPRVPRPRWRHFHEPWSGRRQRVRPADHPLRQGPVDGALRTTRPPACRQP
ncbi:MAG: hypothetical protein OZSIB_2430 [Candidatus Ozemobacter sibiricus]|uniref:Uncharacterized protein n=1 Tax=Candidatus Ozemobacter sibiricus TaxID=2268124 RepID=A0A367ZSD2_9BACT|nr:MAG: hypothetical protein OZSIB_2430 [Candidatus Ozemobacter sibiricus]